MREESAIFGDSVGHLHLSRLCPRFGIPVFSGQRDPVLG